MWKFWPGEQEILVHNPQLAQNKCYVLPKSTKPILALEIAFHMEFFEAFSCTPPRH
jgi:hypothetical protein